MKSSTSGWVVLTRNLVAGFNPQNDSFQVGDCQLQVALGGRQLDECGKPPGAEGLKAVLRWECCKARPQPSKSRFMMAVRHNPQLKIQNQPAESKVRPERGNLAAK